MIGQEKFILSTDDNEIELVPLEHDPVTDAVPCTYRNATDRTVYVWHWPQRSDLYDDPCLLQPICIGESVAIYYPAKYYVRATFGHDSLSNVIEELIVGDIPRHLVLLSEAYKSDPALLR